MKIKLEERDKKRVLSETHGSDIRKSKVRRNIFGEEIICTVLGMFNFIYL